MAVKYCNAACQKAHRPQHKKECKKRAAELFDEALFKQPLKEDCPICFLTLPTLEKGSKYKSCCGKIICSGCIHAVDKMDPDAKCPFCRVPTISEKEIIEMIKKRVEMGDAKAIYSLGCYYNGGKYGFPQDRAKALEHWHRAAELGHTEAYYNIGNAYYKGNGVERDMKKAKHYYELAAMGGDADARYNLGRIEEEAGNMSRAVKHHLIAAGCGDNESLKKIREFFVNGHATKDDYAKALRSYQGYINEIKSDQRDEAASFDKKCCYY